MAEDRDQTLGELFWSVAGRLRRGGGSTLAEWDITPAQSRALRVLLRHGSMRLSELAQHLQIAPRSVTEVVDGLEAKNLVRRAGDPRDRRATMLEVTDHGSTMMAAIRSARGAETDRLFAQLSSRDQAQLRRILRVLDQ